MSLYLEQRHFKVFFWGIKMGKELQIQGLPKAMTPGNNYCKATITLFSSDFPSLQVLVSLSQRLSCPTRTPGVSSFTFGN